MVDSLHYLYTQLVAMMLLRNSLSTNTHASTLCVECSSLTVANHTDMAAFRTLIRGVTSPSLQSDWDSSCECVYDSSSTCSTCDARSPTTNGEQSSDTLPHIPSVHTQSVTQFVFTTAPACIVVDIMQPTVDDFETMKTLTVKCDSKTNTDTNTKTYLHQSYTLKSSVSYIMGDVHGRSGHYYSVVHDRGLDPLMVRDGYSNNYRVNRLHNALAANRVILFFEMGKYT